MVRLLLLSAFFYNILPSVAQVYFPPADGEWESIDYEELNWCAEKVDSLLSFLEAANTKAFMITKNGKIVIEAYFNDHDQEALWYWASAGKTITATLVGRAIEEGLLALEDPVAQYLGTGWTSCDSIEEYQRTIFHQLTMTSSFNSSALLWDCTATNCYQCTGQAPGSEWHYHNGVYRRLIEVVEAATGLTRNQYTNQVIEEITGMSGFWAENLYFSKHRDLARFGWLTLNNFMWNGVPVLSEQEFISDLTSPSQNMNPSYGYLWWLNGQDTHQFPLDPNVYDGSIIPTGPEDMYMALGANDQKIYVIPSDSLVITRQGDAANDMTLAGSSFDVALWTLLSDLECTPLSTLESEHELRLLFENPSSGHLIVPAQDQLEFIELYSANGTLIQRGVPNERIYLEKGVYLVKTHYYHGSVHVQKLLVR